MVIPSLSIMNSKKNIFYKILFFISIILIIYTFYRSEIIWEGNKRNYYNIYYFISFIILLFSISLNFFYKKIKIYVLITFFSFVAGLYSYEVFLNLNLIKTEKLQKQYQGSILQKKQIYEKNTGKKFDTRSKIQVYNFEKEIDPNIKVDIPPSLNLWKNNKVFPLSGFSNSNTIHCNENGYYTYYRSDRYGFNNPDTVWNENDIEYYLVGDSFAHGSCVHENFRIASQLRNLTKKSVINLGYGGTGPLIQYASLKEYLRGNVKKIIWLYYEENDLDNLYGELQDNTLIKYLNNPNFSQNLFENQSLVDAIVYERLKEAQKMTKSKIDQRDNFFSNFLKIIKLYELRSSLRKLYDPILEFEKILRLTKNLSSKTNTQLYFVYLPEYSRYVNSKFSNKNYNKIKKIINRLKIPIIDVHEKVFLKEKDPLELFPFKLYGHYTPEGYEKISRVIYLETQKN